MTGESGYALAEAQQSGLPTGIRGRYLDLVPVGTGAASRVYRARQANLDRSVILKVVKVSEDRETRLAARFLREARVLARLQHPNIVSILDYGAEGAVLFLAYPDSGGRSLDTLLGNGPWEIEAVRRLAEELLSGLRAAHREGVVHRDLKPANVLVLPDGSVQLIDFGLSHVSDETGLTASGCFLGTPAYASPEQATGAEPDPRDDLYALGVIVYELLTGANPFRSDRIDRVFENHAVLVPPRLDRVDPRIPPGLASWVATLLEKEREDRPRDAGIARELLEKACRGDRASDHGTRDPGDLRSARSVPMRSAGLRTTRRAPWRALEVSSLLAVLALAGLVAWSWVDPGAPGTAAAAPDPKAPIDARHEGEDKRILELASGIRDWLSATPGPPELDPAERESILAGSPPIVAFHVWLGEGGRPERLARETRELLREVDQELAWAGLGHPLLAFVEPLPTGATLATTDDQAGHPGLVAGTLLRGWSGGALDALQRSREELAAVERRLAEGYGLDADRWPGPSSVGSGIGNPLTLGLREHRTLAATRQGRIELARALEPVSRFLASACYRAARAVEAGETDASRVATLVASELDRRPELVLGELAYLDPVRILGAPPVRAEQAGLAVALLRASRGSRLRSGASSADLEARTAHFLAVQSGQGKSRPARRDLTASGSSP